MTGISIYKAYAFIANKEAPADIIALAGKIAKRLDEMGYTTRTGGTEGLEDSVEAAVSKVEVYIPWKDFNQKASKFNRNDKSAADLVKPFHPTFDTLKPAIQAIVARNVHIILGKNLQSPVGFVVCWSADGVEHAKDKTAKTGFVGIPIAIASSLKIPVFNLKNADALERMKQFIGM